MQKIIPILLTFLALHSFIFAQKQPKAQLWVSSDKGNSWDTTANIAIGMQHTLTFKVVANGNKNLKLVFPIDKWLSSTEWGKASINKIQGDKVVIDDKVAGVVNINIKDPLTIFSFLKQDIALNVKAAVTCKLLSGSKSMDVVKITIGKVLTPPSITSFTMDKTKVVTNDSVTLSWQVNSYDNLQLYKDNTLVPLLKTQTSYTTPPLLATTTYQLVALNGKLKKSSNPIKVEVVGGTTKNIFGKEKLLNLFTYKSKLYALCLDESAKEVTMRESDDGLRWTPTLTNNKNLTFTQNKPAIPLFMAGSPSIVYKDKLYLIGGSRFDPNIRSNLVYFYDFTTPIKGWQAMDSAAFSPRMGQACVMANGQIWAIGGCTEQGATNEVWALQADSKWKKLGTLPERRMMASVIRYDDGDAVKVQLFGGFGDLPGFADKNISHSYTWDSLNNKWTSMDIEVKYSTEGKDYLACDAAVCQGVRHIFSTGEDYSCNRELIGQYNKCTRLPLDVSIEFAQDDYYDIQAITFKEAIWLCAVKQNNGIKSAEIQSFFYPK